VIRCRKARLFFGKNAANPATESFVKNSIAYGLLALPSLPSMDEIVADTWDKLGPAPEIDYDKL
jgi:hypothetical protein